MYHKPVFRGENEDITEHKWVNVNTAEEWQVELKSKHLKANKLDRKKKMFQCQVNDWKVPAGEEELHIAAREKVQVLHA